MQGVLVPELQCCVGDTGWPQDDRLRPARSGNALALGVWHCDSALAGGGRQRRTVVTRDLDTMTVGGIHACSWSPLRHKMSAVGSLSDVRCHSW